ncbi:TorF family putative porin [Shewanella decolorationis]|uniref:TorF family putative porin n=1 Tax=Shewanella decolorationis TaxID=256839 RepID=UPI001057445C|nr:TorF family putative porin [Shewanella decolorationis]
MKYSLSALMLLATLPCSAATSVTVKVASDYLFNGVSQTQEDPALQASFDWAGDSGLYAGIWGSNVDFGEGTDLEADAYVGYYFALTDAINLDIGIAQYTYHGEGFSSDYNYAESYAKFNYANTNLNFWYSWDYFGTGAGHAIVMVVQSFPINDDLSFDISADYSKSLDSDKWEWETDDDAYIHWRVTANYSWSGWDFTAGYEDTDLETYGEGTFLVTVARTFNF